MGSSRVCRVSLVLLLLIVVSVCAAGGRGLAEEKIEKEHHNAAYKEGTTAPGSHPRNLMVKTNDYGRYDSSVLQASLQAYTSLMDMTAAQLLHTVI